MITRTVLEKRELPQVFLKEEYGAEAKNIVYETKKTLKRHRFLATDDNLYEMKICAIKFSLDVIGVIHLEKEMSDIAGMITSTVHDKIINYRIENTYSEITPAQNIFCNNLKICRIKNTAYEILAIVIKDEKMFPISFRLEWFMGKWIVSRLRVL